MPRDFLIHRIPTTKTFRFNTNFTSKDRRYNAFFIVMNNSLQSSENGGIQSDTFLVNKNPAYNDYFNIPTNLAQVPYYFP